IGGVYLADQREHAPILDLTGGALAGGALVVGGRRHAQSPADRLDPEAITATVDEHAHFGRSGSSSLAKNTDASLRIEFARRSSKFSLRSRPSSSRSSVVRPSRRPMSTSARRTRLRNASSPIPKSRAICAIGRFDSNARRIPRRINSSGYLVRLPMGPEFLPRGANPRNQVSVKPRAAHNW